MPRYFFNSEDGERHDDPEGLELETEAQARDEAIRLAGDLLSDRPSLLWATNRWRVLVADERGKTLFTIEVTTASGAAVTPWS